MKLGVFMKIIVRDSWEQILDAVADLGVSWIHFTLQPIMGESLPVVVRDEAIDKIRDALTSRGLRIASFSGTFNMAHPDPEYRREHLARFEQACRVCAYLGGGVVAVCTGTRHPRDMWTFHPDNQTPEAWRDMTETVRTALEYAEKYNLTLAFEPEANNVVNSASAASRLLQEMQNPHLRVIIDPVNLVPEGPQLSCKAWLPHVVGVLAPYLEIAHAKDVLRTGLGNTLRPPILDYGLFLQLLQAVNFKGPVLIHSVPEAELPKAISFLRHKAAEQGITFEE